MSTANATGVTASSPRRQAAPVRHWLRLFRSELRNVFLRPRNLAMLAVLAGAPVFLGVVLWVNTPAPGSGGDGAGVFIGQIADNGVFLSLFAIYVLLTVLLPLAVSVVSGDSVAGEAGLGTLRTLLTVPAGRTRLLVTKYAMIVVFCFTATLLVAGGGLLMGAIFFPVGRVPPPPSASRVLPEHAADIAGLLAMAVAGIGGAERPGQVAMARAVQTAIETGEHLAVQAGTGTGKSLAYLVPAAVHAISEEATVVVSTATIALQRQLIDRDLPRLAAAIAPALGREPVFAILKGRRNYLCLQRLRGGPADDQDEALFDPGAVSAIGRQVQRLHEWAATTKTGDRDELVPGGGEPAWRQVSVSARECLGAQRCPFGTRCFAELARDDAGRAVIVVTNHALLAIDALEDFDIFPEHDVVIVDEAHDLVDRVTSVASDELSAAAVEVAARRCGRMIEEKAVARLRDAGLGLERMLADVPEGRMDMLDEALASALESVRNAAAGCAAEFRTSAQNDEEPDRLAARRAALAAVGDAADAAERILGAFGPAIADRPDVVWLDRPSAEESGRPSTLRVAPLRVGGLLASRLFGRRTAVLTSPTLALGGSFQPLARQWGLPGLPGLPGPPGAGGDGPAGSPGEAAGSAARPRRDTGGAGWGHSP